MTKFLFKMMVIGLYGISSSAFGDSTRCADPAGDWGTASLSDAGIDEAKFSALIDKVFAAQYSTDGFLVVRKGCLVFERYARGYTAQRRHVGWSVSKSVTSALIGIAEGRAIINREDSIKKYLPYFEKPRQDQIQIKHLLNMASGLDWLESYSNIIASDAIHMLYTKGFRDIPRYVAEKDVVVEPGTLFHYSSGNTNTLMAILRMRMSADDYEAFPWQALFDPLGIKSAVWERDLAGNFIGATALFATARDYARFGLLYMNRGLWGGQQVVPEAWVAASRVLPEPKGPGSRSNYSYGWWLNRPIPEKNMPVPWAGVPEDAFAARGFQGQSVIIVPSLDLVVIRTATDEEELLAIDEFLGPLVAAIKNK